MFEDTLEQWQVMKQAIAPLRLTKWQITKLLAAQLNRDYPLLSKLIIVVGVSFIIWIVSVLTRPKKLRVAFPALGGSRTLKHDFLKIVEEGKHLFPDQPYVVNAVGYQYIVCPARLFDEIKRLPQADASIQDFFYKTTYGKWTDIGTETDAMWKTIAVDLARSVPQHIHSKQADTRMVMDQFIGYAPNYKPINSFETFIQIVARINACSLVGRETALGPWAKGVERLPLAVYVAVMTLGWIPRVLRPVFSPLVFLPFLIVQRNLRGILKPIIKRDIEEYRRAADKKAATKVREDGKLPFTAWLLARYKENEVSEHQLATDYLITSFTANSSTAVVINNVLQDLAVRPALQDELREEIRQTLLDGQLPATNLNELKLLDSVMKETFRTSPFSLFSLFRMLRKTVTFSDGTTIPAGSIICVDAHHINKSATNFRNPLEYDPYRFLKKRSEPGNENRYQFVSTSAEEPTFGDGTQACPGRFFANSVIKVCLVHILMNYDFKLEDGKGVPKPTNMPNGTWIPDLQSKILFKSRV